MTTNTSQVAIPLQLRTTSKLLLTKWCHEECQAYEEICRRQGILALPAELPDCLDTPLAARVYTLWRRLSIHPLGRSSQGKVSGGSTLALSHSVTKC